jgi:hypothetical protein
MPNEVQANQLGDNAFEPNGTNGFMITVNNNSDDLKSSVRIAIQVPLQSCRAKSVKQANHGLSIY